MLVSGVQKNMDLNRLRELIAAPVAGLFLILILYALVAQRPVSTGLLIPTMHKRAEPLTNCEFNGFTVYLRSDGTLAGGDRSNEVSRSVMLSRIKEAQGNVQDDSIFVIADPAASYGDVATLIADIRRADPQDRVTLVTRAGQLQAWSDLFADRCQYEWPAAAAQSKLQAKEPIPLPGGHISVWAAIRGK